VALGIKQDEEYAGLSRSRSAIALMRRASKRWMRRNVEGYLGQLTVLQVQGGQSNPTIGATRPALPMSCAANHSANWLPSAHAVDREFKVIEALHKRGFPSAALRALPRRRSYRVGLLHHVDGSRASVLESDTSKSAAAGAVSNFY